MMRWSLLAANAGHARRLLHDLKKRTDWPIRKEEDYIMHSFYTGNDVIVGRARTNALI